MIRYSEKRHLEPKAIADLYVQSGVDNPITDHERIAKMFDNSNLVISAWDGTRLVGIARALTDFAYCCYLSDLVIDQGYRGSGIGGNLVTLIQKAIGVNVSIFLVSSPSASTFYEKLGFKAISNGYIGEGIL